MKVKCPSCYKNTELTDVNSKCEHCGVIILFEIIRIVATLKEEFNKYYSGLKKIKSL